MTSFAILCFCIVACAIAAAFLVRRASTVFVSLAAAILAVGLFEVYLANFPTPPGSYREGTYVGHHFVSDSELGFAMAPGPRVTTSTLKAADGSVIYDVKYSIDSNGLREVSPTPVADKAVFFLGDSFTFGEGVDDKDALPQQFSVMTGMRAINFAVSAYGAHQVLRELEIDRPRKVESRDPQAIVYVVLPKEHMIRAAGRAEWDQNGPRYEVVNNSLEYLGHFTGPTWWQNALASSLIYTKFLNERVRRTISGADRERLLALILKMRDESIYRYHAQFLVLLWDVHCDRQDPAWLRDRLAENRIATLSLAATQPDLQLDRYYLRGDPHPTGEGLSLAAMALTAFFDKDLRARAPDAQQNEWSTSVK
jgi:hypothetical protein